MFAPEEFFHLEGFAHRSLWKEGEPVWSGLLLLNDYLGRSLFRIEVEIPAGVHLENRGQIAIGRGTVLEPGVLIQGPCIIGKNCRVLHGAYLRSGVILGDGCTVGHAVEMKHSILFDGASASHLCYVGDSILGRGVNLGAGVKCANLRLDRKEISIQKIRTGLRKLGAIVGDRAQIGCNCVLNPGTVVGRESVAHPLLNLTGVIPGRSRVKGSRALEVESIPEKILEQLLN